MTVFSQARAALKATPEVHPRERVKLVPGAQAPDDGHFGEYEIYTSAIPLPSPLPTRGTMASLLFASTAGTLTTSSVRFALRSVHFRSTQGHATDLASIALHCCLDQQPGPPSPHLRLPRDRPLLPSRSERHLRNRRCCHLYAVPHGFAVHRNRP